MAANANGAFLSSPAQLTPSEDERLWKVVNDDPSDFDSWVELARLVEKLNDSDKIRRTLRALLTEYPLCFGYWKRWAAHEKRIAEEATTQAGGTPTDVVQAGYSRSMEVLEQGLRHTSSSIRLWQQFVDEVATGPMPADHIRGMFERAIELIGGDYNAQPIWLRYLEWEQSEALKAVSAAASSATKIELAPGESRYRRVAELYYRVLSIPMAKLEEVYARFQSYSANRLVADICTTAEAKSLLDAAAYSAATSPAPGLNDGGQGALESWSTRSKVLTWRGELFQQTITKLRELDKFEEGLTRPYFHVKAMEPGELDAWDAYLDWAEKRATADAKYFPDTVKLYERCLTACALHVEFWHRYARFLLDRGRDARAARLVLQRATSIFLKRSPDGFLQFAALEEELGDWKAARLLHQKAVEVAPTHLEALIAFVDFERRQAQVTPVESKEDRARVYAPVITIYDDAIARFVKAKAIAKDVSYLNIHYGRFLSTSLRDDSRARRAYQAAVTAAFPDGKTNSNGNSTDDAGVPGATVTSPSNATASEPIDLDTALTSVIAYANFEAGSDASAAEIVTAVSGIYERVLAASSPFATSSVSTRRTLWKLYIDFLRSRGASKSSADEVQRRYRIAFPRRTRLQRLASRRAAAAGNAARKRKAEEEQHIGMDQSALKQLRTPMNAGVGPNMTGLPQAGMPNAMHSPHVGMPAAHGMLPAAALQTGAPSGGYGYTGAAPQGGYGGYGATAAYGGLTPGAPQAQTPATGYDQFGATAATAGYGATPTTPQWGQQGYAKQFH